MRRLHMMIAERAPNAEHRTISPVVHLHLRQKYYLTGTIPDQQYIVARSAGIYAAFGSDYVSAEVGHDKGTPAERQGRKTTGLRRIRHDGCASECHLVRSDRGEERCGAFSSQQHWRCSPCCLLRLPPWQGESGVPKTPS